MASPVYLDYNATTPVAPEVLVEMLPWMTDRFWNAASSHAAGRAANVAVDRARQQLADLLGSSAKEIVWTSGSTEANNLALKGVARLSPPGSKVLVAATEHKAVLDTAYALEEDGYRVDEIAVDSEGLLDLEDLADKLDESVALVSVMLANNETGVIQPISRISRLAHRAGAKVHTDATQALGKIAVDVEGLGVDLASVSAHKFYGPKGVGALYVRRGVKLMPLMHGGGHESGRRSGTLNVPGVVGLGVAAALAATCLEQDAIRERGLVDRLIGGLTQTVPDIEVISSRVERLPNTVNLRFVGADAEAVMVNAPRVFISSGSACTAMIPDASHVLQSMGISQDAAYECLRFSVGRPTTKGEIDAAVGEIATAVGRVRQLVNRTEDTHVVQGARA